MTEIASTPVRPLTRPGTAVLGGVNVPLPNVPLSLLPHASTVPFCCTCAASGTVKKLKYTAIKHAVVMVDTDNVRRTKWFLELCLPSMGNSFDSKYRRVAATHGPED